MPTLVTGFPKGVTTLVFPCPFVVNCRSVSGDIRLTTRYNKQGSKLEVIVHQARLVLKY